MSAGGDPQILPQTLTLYPDPARAGQPCPPAEDGALPVGSAGGAGVQRGLFPLLLCRASTEASSRERLSPRAPLASMDSLGSLDSSSLDSLYSFPEPWPGAMAELAALTRSGTPRSPKAHKGLVGEPGPALGQDTTLEMPAGIEQERVSGDREDRAQSSVHVDLPPHSLLAMATAQGQVVLELIRALQAAQAVTEKYCELLQVALAQWERRWGAAEGPVVGALHGSPPSRPPRWRCKTSWGCWGPACGLGAELPWVDAHVAKAVDPGPDRSSLLLLRKKIQ